MEASSRNVEEGSYADEGEYGVFLLYFCVFCLCCLCFGYDIYTHYDSIVCSEITAV